MPFLTPFIFIFLKCSENLLRYIAGANIYYILKEKLKFKEKGGQKYVKENTYFCFETYPAGHPVLGLINELWNGDVIVQHILL